MEEEIQIDLAENLYFREGNMKYWRLAVEIS